MADAELTQKDIVKEFFLNNPNRDIPTSEVVDWVIQAYLERTGNVFRDPDRAIRSIHQKGFLVKVGKGLYRYDPDLVYQRVLEDFSEQQKILIKERDGYRCVVCGKGPKEGVDLHVDHLKPKDKGGRAVIENGQTLCSQHNFMKKNLDQTESGKKMFIRLYHFALSENDQNLAEFAKAILQIYDNFGINGHIEWDAE